MRALAAFFHGRLGDALAYNRNVLVTAPGVVLLAAHDVASLIRKAVRAQTGRSKISGKGEDVEA
jgi:hypothetical protein